MQTGSNFLMRIKTATAFLLLTFGLTACNNGGEVGLPTDATALEEQLAHLETLEGDFLALELAQGEPAFVIPPELGAAHPITENINLGRWGDLIDWPEIAVGAANMPDGRVVTWSATRRNGFGGFDKFTFGSVWNPETGTFTDMPNENHNNFCAGVAMLADGSIMTPGGGATITTNSIFDGNSWNLAESLNEPRWYPQSTTLPGGQVFTALGTRVTGESELWTEGEGYEILPGADLDLVLADDSAPAGNSWWFPALNVAPDGTLFHPGPTSEIFSLDLNSNDSIRTEFGSREDNHSTRLYNTTVMYDIGKMLVAGGGEPAVNTALTIDLNGSAPVVTPIAPMNFARSMQNSVVLPNGKVLIIGGNSSGRQFSDAGTQLVPELWDPQTGQWQTLASHGAPRNYHSTALLLKDGRVASMGGGLCGGCDVNYQNGEIFEPPYLFNEDGTPADRPEIFNGPDDGDAGDSLTFTATPGLESFSMLRLVALTHHHTTDQRFIPLDFFETSPGTYEVQLPSNTNVLIPGYYWVYGLNSDGVPSEGATLMVNTTAPEVGEFVEPVPEPEPEPIATLPVEELADNVSYEYFEGNWTELPDFDSLTPVATGTQSDFSLDEAQVEDFFAFRFTSTLEITDAGPYTFFTQSDDGSQLFINDQLVVDNDGRHGRREEQGTINLAAGTHDIVLTFFEGLGLNNLTVQMEGPSIARQDVQVFVVPTTDATPTLGAAGDNPTTSVSPVTPTPTASADNVAYEYYEGVWTVLPEFDNLTPVATGTQNDFSLDQAQVDDFYAFRFTSTLELDEAGAYTFFTQSDDGSQLFINGNLVVDNDGRHGRREMQGSMNLAAGTHQIVVTFFEGVGFNNLTVQMQGPSVTRQDVDLFLTTSNTPVAPPAPPVAPVNEVAFEYYEGVWTELPDFDSLTPVATGTQSDFGLDNAQVEDFYAFRFTSTLELDDAGTYTFFTQSDDGSQLFINGNLVVDNNGLHGRREREGTVNLTAGTHEIVVTFFERVGFNNLTVQMEGPSITRQDVDLFLTEPGTPAAANPVVDPTVDPTAPLDDVAYEYYEGIWTELPDFDSLTPIATGTQSDFSLDAAQVEDFYAFRFTAEIEITEAGDYRFLTKSDDGSQLFINGSLVVDNDGLHGRREREGTVNLSAGTHEIVVTFFERIGFNNLSILMEGPSTALQDVESFLVSSN